MNFSRTLAYVGGVVLPVAETIRRWHQLGDWHMAPAWLDDYVIGAFLLYGAWRAGRDAAKGGLILIAAWGFACGMGTASFASQLANLDQPDPSGLVSMAVAFVKGLMLGLSIAALSTAVKAAGAGKGRPA
jgi:hypothetical protein